MLTCTNMFDLLLSCLKVLLVMLAISLTSSLKTKRKHGMLARYQYHETWVTIKQLKDLKMELKWNENGNGIYLFPIKLDMFLDPLIRHFTLKLSRNMQEAM